MCLGRSQSAHTLAAAARFVQHLPTPAVDEIVVKTKEAQFHLHLFKTIFLSNLISSYARFISFPSSIISMALTISFQKGARNNN